MKKSEYDGYDKYCNNLEQMNDREVVIPLKEFNQEFVKGFYKFTLDKHPLIQGECAIKNSFYGNLETSLKQAINNKVRKIKRESD